MAYQRHDHINLKMVFSNKCALCRIYFNIVFSYKAIKLAFNLFVLGIISTDYADIIIFDIVTVTCFDSGKNLLLNTAR